MLAWTFIMESNMNYKEDVYKKALDCILDIYNRSKSDPDSVDFFRIYDIINSVNDNQFTNKEWLVHNLKPLLKPNLRILIAGSWYGLLARMINQLKIKGLTLDLVDMDRDCLYYSKIFNPEDQFPNTKSIKRNAVDFFIEKSKRYDLLINTSCEHMEKNDVQLMIGLKKPECIFVGQSNNYDKIDSHINTSTSLSEFQSYLKLKEVFFADTLSLKEYDRYMVIGK